MLDDFERFFLNYRSDTDMVNHVYFDYFIYCTGITSLKTDEPDRADLNGLFSASFINPL
jgi:hypothetical protein